MPHCGSFRFPNDFAAHCHVAALFWREILRDGLAVRGAEVPYTPRKIHADVNLTVGIGEFVRLFGGTVLLEEPRLGELGAEFVIC